MNTNIRDQLFIDVDHILGKSWGVKAEDLKRYEERIRKAASDVEKSDVPGKDLMGAWSFFPISRICWRRMS